MYWIGIGTEAAVLNSQAVPISRVVLKTGFTVQVYTCICNDTDTIITFGIDDISKRSNQTIIDIIFSAHTQACSCSSYNYM